MSQVAIEKNLGIGWSIWLSKVPAEPADFGGKWHAYAIMWRWLYFYFAFRIPFTHNWVRWKCRGLLR
jgi:hypothetical protein